MRLINDNTRLRLKPHHQAHRHDAVTAPLPRTRVTELGWWIGHRRSVRSDQSLRHQCLASNPSSPPMPQCAAATLGATHQASLKVFYTTSLSSLSFSLLIFGFCSFAVECGLTGLFYSKRESSLSFWTDSFSLSLYNYSIYLPLFFFFFYLIRWCVTRLVSWCWWVCLLVLNLSDWLLLCESYLLSGDKLGPWGRVVWGQGWNIWIGDVKAFRGKGVCTHEVCANAQWGVR